MPFSLFLALKYLKPKRTFISVVTLISVMGVLLGVMVVVIVLAVMNGFDDMWRDKILSFNAHLTVSREWVIDEGEELVGRIRGVEGVTGAAPSIQGLVFIQHRDRVFTPMLRGIDPRYEGSVSKIPEHIVRGEFTVDDGHAVIGQDLAFRLGVTVGDDILVYSPQSFSSPDEIRLPEELTVSGIFELGMWDFDMGYILTSLETARDLYDIEDGIHAVLVMTHDPFLATVVADELSKELGSEYDISTWMQLNRQLFSALQVEKNMMFFLLIFISLVAAFGVMNTLITLTVQKTREIGLLKALGYSSGSIMRVFVLLGWVQAFIGTAGGILGALIVLRYRNDLMDLMSRRLHVELLPKELYHLSEIPSSLSWMDVGMVTAIVWVMCTVAGLIPAALASMKNPAEALRYE